MAEKVKQKFHAEYVSQKEWFENIHALWWKSN